MITKILSTAVKFYLRSQVSRVEDLQVRIDGKNRQILKGYIPQVFISCREGVYRGLHLREVELKGNDIAVNLPEVLKNKPLKLLEPIVVEVKLKLDANDLLKSLDSDLLQSGLSDLWNIVLSADKKSFVNARSISNIEWTNISLSNDRLTFSGIYQGNLNKVKQLNLSAGIYLSNSHTLCLSLLKISNNLDIVDEPVDKLEIDLGKDVAFEDLTIASEQISCLGKITVNN